MKLKKLAVLFVVLLLLLAAFTAAAQAKGNNPDQLMEAGWICMGPPAPDWHCIPPRYDFDVVVAGGYASVPVKVFSGAGVFLGTEILIHEDLYHEQPCPPDEVIYLNGPPIPEPQRIPYYACHHFDF